jgi:flavin-dependent dehydrogenase
MATAPRRRRTSESRVVSARFIGSEVEAKQVIAADGSRLWRNDGIERLLTVEKYDRVKG